MELRPGYKQTEVGIIPNEWEVLALGKLASIERGKFTARPRNDPKYYGGNIPFIQTGDVTRSRGTISEYRQTLNATGLKVSRMFPRGTLFFTIAANIGDVGIATFDTACPDSLVAIRPNSQTNQKWLLYELARRKTAFESIATHNAQLNINLEKLRPYLMLVPTEPEQRAIAETLSDVDELIAGLEGLIAKKLAIKQATMQQLLTGKTRLLGFDRQWVTKPLGTVAHIRTGSRNNEDKVEDGEYPFFVRSESVERINTYEYECEAILVPGEGRIGNIFHYVDGRFDVHQRVYAITRFASTVVAKFIYYYMAMNFGNWAMQHTVKATVDSLRLPTFQKFEMLIPPSTDEQTAIAAVLGDMDTEIAALQRKREKTRAIKQGMMQQLLTGRIRLVKPKTEETDA